MDCTSQLIRCYGLVSGTTCIVICGLAPVDRASPFTLPAPIVFGESINPLCEVLRKAVGILQLQIRLQSTMGPWGTAPTGSVSTLTLTLVARLVGIGGISIPT
jgi:hypothetical protein